MVDSKKLLIRHGLPVRFVSAPIERKHFGELTQGNQIRFTVDGEETFNLIYEAINQAESSIYIAGYDLDPYLNFVRESSDDATKTSNITSR